MNSDFRNIIEWLFYQSDQQPEKNAYVADGGESVQSLSFAELKAEVIHISNLLQEYGINKGDKVLLLFSPKLELAITLYSLLGIGAVPIVVDPSMGFTAISRSIIRAQPDTVICEPFIKRLLPLFAKTFASVSSVITTDQLKKESAIIQAQPAILYRVPEPEDLAAIFFTSGSTGWPKPVEWRHRQLLAHVVSISRLLAVGGNEIVLALYPLSMLISPVMGVTCHVPDFKKVKPEKADCHYLCQLINTASPTICFASPAVWNKLANYCQSNQLCLPSIHYAVSGGAPIAGKLADPVRSILPNGKLYMPYGVTEANPIACANTVEFSEKLGIKLGKPVTGIDCAIEQHKGIVLPDESLQVGEIRVAGDLVSQHYHLAPELDAKAKKEITENGESRCWHMTGDVGVLDENGELWYLGRLNDVVIDQRRCYFTAIAEGKINRLSQVAHAALIAIRHTIKQQIIMVVETEQKMSAVDQKLLNVEIKKQLASNDYWVDTIEYINKMPLDKRNDSKIDRAALRLWVEKKVNKK